MNIVLVILGIIVFFTFFGVKITIHDKDKKQKVMNDKILIGKKDNVDRGYMFYPYIKVLEFKLPILFKEFDVERKPIFIKNEKIESYG